MNVEHDRNEGFIEDNDSLEMESEGSMLKVGICDSRSVEFIARQRGGDKPESVNTDWALF